MWAGTNVGMLGAYDGKPARDVASALIDQVDSMIGPQVQGL